MDLTQIHHPDWFYMIVMSRCYVIDKYIKSLAWEQEKGVCPFSGQAARCVRQRHRGSFAGTVIIEEVK